MKTDLLQAKWVQLKGIARELWGEISGDELEFIAGRRDRLIGKLEEIYGLTPEEAARQVDQLLDRLR